MALEGTIMRDTRPTQANLSGHKGVDGALPWLNDIVLYQARAAELAELRNSQGLETI